MRSILKNKKAESEGLGVGYILGIVVVAIIIIIMVLFWTETLDLKAIFGNMLPQFGGGADGDSYDEINYADEEIRGTSSVLGELIIVNESVITEGYATQVAIPFYRNEPRGNMIYFRPYLEPHVWTGSYSDLSLHKKDKVILIVRERAFALDKAIGIIIPTGGIYFSGDSDFLNNLGWKNRDNLFLISNSVSINRTKLIMAYCGEDLEKCGVSYKTYLILPEKKFNIKTNMMIEDFEKLYDSL